MRYALDPKVNEEVKNDKDDKAVQTALQVIEKSRIPKNDRDNKNIAIKELFEKGFTVSDPFGTMKLSSKLLQQAMQVVMQRVKFLDFQLHGSGRDEAVERLVTDGVSTIMDRGNLANVLRGKQGLFFNTTMFSDGFMQIGASPNENKQSPLAFSAIDNSAIYIDPSATTMRNGANGRDVTKCVVVYSYPWAEALRLYPELKRKKVAIGKIPRAESEADPFLSMTWDQELERDDDDIIEIAHYYDIGNKYYTVFAGRGCTKIREFKGDNYPFMKDDAPYIPIIHFLFMPSAEGFYNHGLGDVLFDIAILQRRLMNLGYQHAEDNVYPIEIVNVPQGQAGEFFKKLETAHQMRAKGSKAFVTMEVDPNNPNANRVDSQSLLTNSLVNEWQLLFDRLTQEITRLGINIDSIRTDRPTATQIISEDLESTMLVRQMMEYNAGESKFLVEVVIDLIKEFVSEDDDTPIDTRTMLPTANGEELAPVITMGMVAEELNANNYFVKVNARTGVIPSNVMQQAQISRILPLTQPGTKAYAVLAEQLAKLNDRDISAQDFMAPFGQPQGAPPQEAIEGAGEPALAGTERQAVGLGRLTEEPVI